MKKMEIDFTCPHCKKKASIVETCYGATYEQTLKWVEGIFYRCENIKIIEDGEESECSCSNCGEVLFDADEVDLMDYLKDNGFLKE